MQGFQKVVGHQEIITHLQNAISMNKVSHAYLFGGESGSGKKMMASLFAMTLQCEKHGVEPCMECPSCKKAQSQNHPDIIYVKHEKPNTISIDEIKSLQETLSLLEFKCWYYSKAMEDGTEEYLQAMLPDKLPSDIQKLYDASHK